MSDVLLFLAPALKAVALLVIGWTLGGALRRPLGRFLDGRIDPTLRAFLVGTLRPVFLLLALPPALDALGVSMSSALALLSTAGLAIALALRESLSNVASGAIVLTMRPFGVGDLVTLGTVTGRVQQVGFLTTVLDAEDGRRLFLTNDKVLANPIERHAVHDRARTELVLRVPAEQVTPALIARLLDAAREVGGEHAELVPLEIEGPTVRFAARAFGPLDDLAEIRARLLVKLLGVLRTEAL